MLVTLIVLVVVAVTAAGLYMFLRRPPRLLVDDEANEVLEAPPVGRHRRREVKQ